MATYSILIMLEIVGRKYEISLLQGVLKSPEATLIAVYGRRRVGKTYLIQKTYAAHLIFEFCGINKVTTTKQLQNFNQTITTGKKKLPLPKNWLEAFHQFKQVLKRYTSTKKINVFKQKTNTRKNVFLTFITSKGLESNKYKTALVQNELTLNDLFIDL